MFYCTNDYYVGGVVMRLTEKNKIKELETLQKNKVLMTDADYKELKLGQLEDILEKYNIDTNDELEVLCKYAEDVKHWMSEIKRIEEELGIDLITLFKALKNGIYWKDDNGKIYYFDLKGSVLDFNEKMIVDNPIDDIYGETFLLKDYGTTWALTKEGLENETNE